jgi:hypothetical protein
MRQAKPPGPDRPPSNCFRFAMQRTRARAPSSVVTTHCWCRPASSCWHSPIGRFYRSRSARRQSAQSAAQSIGASTTTLGCFRIHTSRKRMQQSGLHLRHNRSQPDPGPAVRSRVAGNHTVRRAAAYHDRAAAIDSPGCRRCAVHLHLPAWRRITGLLSGAPGSRGHELVARSALALGSIIAITVWKNTGYYMLFFLAGLAGIPQELLHAAKIDAAGAWQRFVRVTIPLLGRRSPSCS